MDPITDIVTLLRPHAAFSKPITGKGDWGVRYAAYKEPGFAIVLQGQCWLAAARSGACSPRTRRLRAAACLAGLRAVQPAWSRMLAGRSVGHRRRHGDPTGSPSSKCWAAHSASTRSTPRSSWPCCPRWSTSVQHDGMTRLAQIVGLITDECGADRPGKEMVLQRFLDVMLVECLRRPGVAQGDCPPACCRGCRIQHWRACSARCIPTCVRAGPLPSSRSWRACRGQPSRRASPNPRLRADGVSVALAYDAGSGCAEPRWKIARPRRRRSRIRIRQRLQHRLSSTVGLLPGSIRPAQARRNRASDCSLVSRLSNSTRGRLQEGKEIVHPYSHSIVPGGLLVTSYTTRFTPFTSLMIRVAVSPRNFMSKA